MKLYISTIYDKYCGIMPINIEGAKFIAKTNIDLKGLYVICLIKKHKES